MTDQGADSRVSTENGTTSPTGNPAFCEAATGPRRAGPGHGRPGATDDTNASRGRLRRRLPFRADLPERPDRDPPRRGRPPVRSLAHDAGAALRRPAEPLGRVLGRAVGHRLRAPRAAAHRATRVVGGRARVRGGPAGAGAVARGAAVEGPAGRGRVRPAVAGAADGRDRKSVV